MARNSVEYEQYLLITREHVKEMADILEECAQVQTQEQNDKFTQIHGATVDDVLNGIVHVLRIALENPMDEEDAHNGE